MRHFLLLLASLSIICLGSFAPPVYAEGFVRADHQRIVDGKGNPLILRGLGLGGWMVQEGYMMGLANLKAQHIIRRRISEVIGEKRTEQFYRSWRENAITKADIDAMAKWGFNSVRLPMHWNLFIEDKHGRSTSRNIVWNEEGFRRIDVLIRWLKANNMYLILDLHAAPGGQGHDIAISDRNPNKPSLWHSDENQAMMIALWSEIARRYRDESTIAGYDLLNEPNWGFQDKKDKGGCRETENRPLRDIYQRTIRAIRAIDTNHMLVIEGNCWGNNYAGVLPIDDRNAALSFHKYWTPTTQESIEPFLKLREQYDMPLWNGESGENNNDWYARAVELQEKNGIGWSWWPLKKMGAGNPLEIKTNANYRRLTAYLRGEGKKPSARSAFAGLMQLATDSRYDRNIHHQAVVDALMGPSRKSGMTE